MIPLADVIANLQRSQREVAPGMERTMGVLMEENAALSKAMIGQELPIWPPLAPSTVREKERLGYVGQVSPTDPLLRTGHLRDSIEPVVHPEFDGVTGEVGTDVPYARDLEHGTAQMPPRPFISVPFITIERRAVEAFGKLAVDLLRGGQP